MTYFIINSKIKLYRIVRDTPAGTVSLSGEFTNLENCKKKLKEKANWIKSLKEGNGWGLPYIIIETITYEKLKEDK